jgi:hypothetical protein
MMITTIFDRVSSLGNLTPGEFAGDLALEKRAG